NPSQAVFSLTPSSAAAESNRPPRLDPLPGQATGVMPDGSLRVFVYQGDVSPPPTFDVANVSPQATDLQPNRLIDYRSVDVRRIADSALAKRSDLTQRQTALALTSTANALIGLRNSSQGFSKASDVVKDLQGDCTDHAVLLAALLRSRQIPARLALGLRYVADPQPQMVYHAWVLAYVDDNWLALDSTLGGLAPADRFALSMTQLGDGQEYEAMAPLLNALGSIEIEVLPEP
ncbi:MAG: transglutaminase-like domain-containing protein, partial [Pirellulales bacterium]|nr:transglutaminase-like domain-containing protein [Pirellulales bacterium]